MITSRSYLNRMINYKDDTFYDKQTKKLFAPVKIIYYTAIFLFAVYIVWSVITRDRDLKKSTYKSSFSGEIRAFFYPKRGGSWIYVDGGDKKFDIEIGVNSINLKTGDSIYKLANSSQVFIKRLHSKSWMECEGQEFLLLNAMP